jgi:cytochrome b subunit of formate dehydrogenase
MSGARAFATAGLVLTIVGAVGTALVRYASPVPIISQAFGFGATTMVGYLVQGLIWASIGALLVVRRPTNAVGWLMVAVGVGYSASQLTVSMASSFAAAGTAEGDHLAQIAGWSTVLLQLVTILHFAIGFLFPSGRAQSPRWGRFLWLFWAFAVVFAVISLIQPGPLQLIPALENPFGFGPDLRGGRPIAPILVVAAVIVFVSLAISMVARYRSAGLTERQQLKWFVLALGVSSIGLGIATTEGLFNDRPENGMGLTVYVYAGAIIPIAIGIAILRYRLYDIDRIISRTIAYAAVTAMIGAIFTALLVVLTGLMTTVAGGESLAVAASTLLAAALFQPLRRGVQVAVDHRFNRVRYDAERTATDFAERLRDEVDLATVSGDIVGVVDTALRPSAIGVWIRRPGPTIP